MTDKVETLVDLETLYALAHQGDYEAICKIGEYPKFQFDEENRENVKTQWRGLFKHLITTQSEYEALVFFKLSIFGLLRFCHDYEEIQSLKEKTTSKFIATFLEYYATDENRHLLHNAPCELGNALNSLRASLAGKKSLVYHFDKNIIKTVWDNDDLDLLVGISPIFKLGVETNNIKAVLFALLHLSKQGKWEREYEEGFQKACIQGSAAILREILIHLEGPANFDIPFYIVQTDPTIWDATKWKELLNLRLFLLKPQIFQTLIDTLPEYAQTQDLHTHIQKIKRTALLYAGRPQP